MKENGLVPKRRFKEFENSGAWEQRKLGDITETITKGTTPIDKNWVGPVNYIKTESIDKESGNLTNTSNTSLEEHEGFLKRSQLKSKDVLFSIVGTLGRVGLVKTKDLPANTNQQIAIIRLKEIDSYFVANSLKTPHIKSFITSETTIGAQPSLSLWQIDKMKIGIPSIEEQKKIGQFFNNLDNLITLHQRKLKKLKNLKLAYLSEMFPKEGEKYPKRRFAGFTGPWEQRKLGEISSKIGSGKTPRGGEKAYKDHGVYLIRSQNINYGAVNFSDIVYIDDETDEEMKNSRVLNDDVLLNITGASIGRSAVYQGLDRANVNQHVCIIRLLSGETSPEFIHLNLTSNNGQKQIDSSQAGGAREGLNFQQISKFTFLFPGIQEQEKIGLFFKHLDNLITLHQRKLEKLENIKQAYLNEMFV